MNFTGLFVEARGGTPHRDTLKTHRLADDLRMVVEEGQPLLRANGIEIDCALLETILPEVFSLAEFRDGLGRLASPT